MTDRTNNNSRQHQKLLNYEYQQASQFYEEKLQNFPTMSRYTHFMAALSSKQGKIPEADHYYRQTLTNAPHDIFVKNDFAVHLSTNYSDRQEDAYKELKKALILNNESSLLHKNMAAVLGSQGELRKALDHANQAKFLAPRDTMNYRNIARLEAMLGDSHSSLKNNLTSIEMEEENYQTHGMIPNTSAYRKAAVQIISKGGNSQEALELMNKARKYENKVMILSTSQRTYEIINKLKSRQADEFKQVQSQKKAEEEKKLQSKATWEKLLQDMTK